MSNDAPKSEAKAGGDVTRVLERAQKGDPNAAAELLPLVYDELRRLAAARMAHERPDQTLQPTALVHEAWLRLVANENQEWNGRAHFFGAAAGPGNSCSRSSRETGGRLTSTRSRRSRTKL